MFEKTVVDSLPKLNVSLFIGPPGPPGGLVVTSVNDTSVELRWSRGYDNHSPIGKYIILGRSSQTHDWKRMRTGEVTSLLGVMQKQQLYNVRINIFA